MIKNMNYLQYILAVLMLAAASCGSLVEGGDGSEKGEKTLQNTSWKLVGFYDVEKKEFKEPEGKNCEYCYSLVFYDIPATDSWSTTPLKTMCRGITTDNNFNGIYIIDYAHSIVEFDLNITLGTETHDGGRYYMYLKHAHAFELKGGYLRIYYKGYDSDNINYLLLKRRQYE